MKISYIIHHGVAERADFIDDGSDTLILAFKPECDGAVIIGGVPFDVKDGESTIPLKAIGDGEHHPRLECDGGVYAGEPFVKYGRGVSLPKTDETVVRRLILRCYELERSSDSLGQRIARLETMCQGHNIFNFERKQT